MQNLIKLSELATTLNLKYEGKDSVIDGLGLCDRDTEYKSIISYVTNEKYINHIYNNKAISCLVIPNSFLGVYTSERIGRSVSYIISDNPEVCFYNIHEYLCKYGYCYEKFNFESKIGMDCHIAPSAVIEVGVIIGNHVSIGANSVIKSGSIIDDNTVIGCNTTIGSEGFQLITDNENMPMHITHVGKCHICTNVYIGDNTCICNSLFGGETYVGEGAKIDNLVHVAHNLYIGKNAVITAHVILCGSSRVEEYAWIAPNSSVLNKVIVGKGAKVGLGSVVTRNVAPYTVVYGSPAKAHEKQ